MVRVPCCERMGLKKGPWTAEEDQILISYIQRYGHENWRALPRQAGLLRCGKSCRLRWTNYLRPDIKRGNFTKEEQETIIKLHQMLGNRWSAIATKLPGRTDNEIKNYWHTHLKKRVEENPASSTSLAATADTAAAAASERLMRFSSSILGTNHPTPAADSNFQKNGYNNYPQDNNLHYYYGHEQNYHHHGCISTAAAQGLFPFANNKYNYYYYSMDGLLDSSSRTQILSTNGEYSAVLQQQQPWGGAAAIAVAAGNHEYCKNSDMVFWYDLLVKSQQENQEKVA